MGLNYFRDLVLCMTIGYISLFGFLCAAQMIHHELFSKKSREDEAEKEGEAIDDDEQLNTPDAETVVSIDLVENLDQVLKFDKASESNHFEEPSTSKAAIMQNKLHGMLYEKYNNFDKNISELSERITESENIFEKDNEEEKNKVAIEFKIQDPAAELLRSFNEQSVFIEEEIKADEHSRSKRATHNNITPEVQIEEITTGLAEPFNDANFKIEDDFSGLEKQIDEAEGYSQTVENELVPELTTDESNGQSVEVFLNNVTEDDYITLSRVSKERDLDQSNMFSMKNEISDEDQNQPLLNDDVLTEGSSHNENEELKEQEIKVQSDVHQSLIEMQENNMSNIDILEEQISIEHADMFAFQYNSEFADLEDTEELSNKSPESVYLGNHHHETNTKSIQEDLLEIEKPCERKYSSNELLNEAQDLCENYLPTLLDKSVKPKSESWRDEYGLIFEGVSHFYDFQASTNPSRSRTVSPLHSQSPSYCPEIRIRNEDKAADVLTAEEMVEMRELVDSLRVTQQKLDYVNRTMNEISRNKSLSPPNMKTLCVEADYSHRRSRSRSPLPTENNLQKSLDIRRSKLIHQNDEAFQKLGVKIDDDNVSIINIPTDNSYNTPQSENTYKPKRDYNWRKNFNLDVDEPSTASANNTPIQESISTEILMTVEMENSKDVLDNVNNNIFEKHNIDSTEEEKERNYGNKMNSSHEVTAGTEESFDTTATIWVLTKKNEQIVPISPLDFFSSTESSDSTSESDFIEINEKSKLSENKKEKDDNIQELKEKKKQEIFLSEEEKGRNYGNKMHNSYEVPAGTEESFNTSLKLWVLTQQDEKVTPITPFDFFSSVESSVSTTKSESIENPTNKIKVERAQKTFQNNHLMKGLSDFYDFLRVESNNTSNPVKNSSSKEPDNTTTTPTEIHNSVGTQTVSECNDAENEILKGENQDNAENIDETRISDNFSSEDQTADLSNVMESYDLLKDANLYPLI